MNLPRAKPHVCLSVSKSRQRTLPVGSAGSLLMCASSDADTRGCSCGRRYIGIQKTSQINPTAPVTMNADCQPKFSASHGTIIGAAIAPTFEPALTNPIAIARSFLGNHSASVLVAAGYAGDSVTPSSPRANPKPHADPTTACSIDAT